jgi:hypothetical protein
MWSDNAGHLLATGLRHMVNLSQATFSFVNEKSPNAKALATDPY